MIAPARRIGSEPRRIAGEPLALVIAVLLLWTWGRATWLMYDTPMERPLIGHVGLPEERAPDPAGYLPSATNPTGSVIVRAAVMPRRSAEPGTGGGLDRGGIAGTLPDKWLRLAALGGRWSFNTGSAAGGWRGGIASAGYRDANLGNSTTSLWDSRFANNLVVASTALPPTRASRRWSASAWLLARPGSATTGALIPRYGASQAGALVEYRLTADASPRAYLRTSRALVSGGEAEVATGVSFDIPGLPVAGHVERRFALNAAGRDAMAVFVSGGFASGDPSQLALEGFGQAGIVGLRRRTPFADATLVARRRIVESGPVSVSAGAGGWTGAQPGATRVDIGPRLEASFDDGLHGRLSLDWRERVGGRAEPGSGAAMTLSLSF